MPQSAPAYTSVTTNPKITGDGIDDLRLYGAHVVNVGIRWESNLTKVPTLGGSKGVPDIPKGQVVVSLLVAPSGVFTPVPFIDLSTPVTVDVNGTAYNNTYHAGGQLQTKDFGEGLRALVVSKMFTVFGLCSGAVSS